MLKISGKVVYKNIPNIVSILGILPLSFLFIDNGYQYIIPLIIYNNIMDDLDGILAAKLRLKSDFGAKLDNIADAVTHTLFVMVIGMHYGLICGVISFIAIVAIFIRVVSRLSSSDDGGGSPTNELIRHIFFTILLSELFGFDPVLFLIIVFLINAISMIWSYPMPYMIRSQAKTAFAVCMVNVFLVLAWLVPYTSPVIAGCFIFAYLFSFVKAFTKQS